MPGTVTFQSNLTSVDLAGSTVTSASTSDQIAITTTTSAHSSITQTVANVAQASSVAANLGLTDVTKEHCVRIRHLGWASTGATTGTLPCVEIAVQTGASTFVLLSRVYPTETFGPIRLAAQVSGYPKLALRATNSVGDNSGVSSQNVEVVASDLGTPAAP